MTYFNRWSGLAILLLLLGCSRKHYPAKQKNESPRAILQSVKNRYYANDKLEARADVAIGLNMMMQGFNRTQTVDGSIYFASQKPGKIRLEMTPKKSNKTLGRILTISDGNAVWRYFSAINQYSKKDYAIVQASNDYFREVFKNMNLKGNFPTNFSRAFNPLADSIEHISSPVIDTLRMPNSTSRRAYKIEVRYTDSNRASPKSLREIKQNPMISVKNNEVSPTTFWIDPDSRAVLRETSEQSTEMAIAKKQSMKMQIRSDIFYTSVNLQPALADSLFVFDPPKGAKEVKQLHPMKGMGKKMAGQQKTDKLVGKKAIDFKLRSYSSGKNVHLSSLKGKVVVLDFWATWCGPCRRELPHIQKLSRELKDKDVVILGINNEKKEKVRRFVQKKNYTFINLHDRGRAIAKKYGVQLIPSIFIINPKGDVTSYMKGLNSEASLRKAIKKAGE